MGSVGLRMRELFDVARAHTDLSLDEVDRLLDHPAYEPRMTAMCILDFRARRRLDDGQRRELYELYLDRHEAITTWDMVDRAAPLQFIRAGSDDDLAEGFAVAARLADDRDPTVYKPVGIFLEHASTRDPAALHRFLAQHAATMPRPALRLAVAKLDPGGRAPYLA